MWSLNCLHLAVYGLFTCIIIAYWAIPFNIRTPPVEDWPFPLTPKEFRKKVLPPEDFLKKWAYPWRISQGKVFTPEEFNEISVYPWRFPLIIWVLPLKNSSASVLYPWRIPPLLSLTPEEFHCSSTGGVRILNGIAHSIGLQTFPL